MTNVMHNSFLCVEIKCQLDATDDFYCRSYCLLNMFRGHHYANHQELESVIQVVAACRIWCFGFQVVCMVWTGSNHLYNTLELLMMGIMVPETCWASNKICNKYHLLHLVGILFPHINDDAGQNHIKFIFYVFISIYNSVHVSSTSCSSSGETNCINTASGNSHSLLVAEMCAGWE